jgi:hypothetical protein
MDGFTRGDDREVVATADQSIGAADRSLRALVTLIKRNFIKNAFSEDCIILKVQIRKVCIRGKPNAGEVIVFQR